MPGFPWELQQDIALASEVATSRPQKLQDWDEIAVTLSAVFSSDEKPVQLKSRGCRERMDLLLKKEIHVFFIIAQKVGVATFL